MVENGGVSIIIDAFNQENFVAAAIESALAQDYSPIQVIVIDDGSLDRSQEIIKGFDERVEAVFQENQGQVAAVKKVLPLAQHDVVIILDADDMLDPHAVSTVMAVWREGVIKVQYSLRVIDENGVSKGNFFPKYTSKMTPELMRAEIFRTGSYPDSPTSGNAFDRRLLEEVLPLVRRRNGFDGEVNALASLYGSIITISEPQGCYRIHGSNDFSQNQLRVEKFGDYVRHCEDKVAFVREHFQAKGHNIDDDVLNRDLKYLEYRLVLEKLGAVKTNEQRRLLSVAGYGLHAAWTSPYALMSKILRMTWIAVITLAPKGIARSLIEQRFIPGRRKRWITRLATLGWRSGDRPATSIAASEN